MTLKAKRLQARVCLFILVGGINPARSSCESAFPRFGAARGTVRTSALVVRSDNSEDEGKGGDRSSGLTHMLPAGVFVFAADFEPFGLPLFASCFVSPHVFAGAFLDSFELLMLPLAVGGVAVGPAAICFLDCGHLVRAARGG